jgi:hypothetical protein
VGRPRPMDRMFCGSKVDECVLFACFEVNSELEAAAGLHSFAIRSIAQKVTVEGRRD